MKVLVATEKPFAKAATDGIRGIVEAAGYKLELLEKYTDVAQFHAAVADADALIVRSDKVTKAVVDAAKNLKIVVRAGAGFDNLDIEALSARKIVAMNTPGQNSNAVAELAVGMMIFMARAQFGGAGTEISGKTLGIHGLGNIGKIVSHMAAGFGMKVVAYAPSKTDEYIKEAGAEPVRDIKKFYAMSDYVSLNIPAKADTKKSIGYDLLMSMPKGATLVNTARKEVIDEEGLLKAMEERQDLKYATDVAPDAAAVCAEKFGKRYFATPKKIGAETSEANINAGLAAASQIVDYIKNGNETFRVNK